MDILYAILDNNLERVRELISENPEILNQLPHNPLILSIASYNENEVRLQIIKLILDHYNNLNIRDSATGKTPLMLAIELNNLPIATLLLNAANEKHIDILDIQDVNLPTPLIQAIEYAQINGNEAMIRLLLDHGADPNSPSNSLEQAIRYGNHQNIKQLLRERGAEERDTEVLPERNIDNVNSVFNFVNRLQCPVCLTNAVNTRLNPCGHLMCSTCYNRLPVPKICPLFFLISTILEEVTMTTFAFILFIISTKFLIANWLL
jgi:ankyrin repeat protein